MTLKCCNKLTKATHTKIIRNFQNPAKHATLKYDSTAKPTKAPIEPSIVGPAFPGMAASVSRSSGEVTGHSEANPAKRREKSRGRIDRLPDNYVRIILAGAKLVTRRRLHTVSLRVRMGWCNWGLGGLDIYTNRTLLGMIFFF